MFRSLQETDESRNSSQAERLAKASVNSQKQSDEYSRVNLFAHMYYLQDEPRQKAYNVYSNMSSYFKGREGGAASSFNSVRFYNNQAKNKRAELIEKYNTEVAVAVHTGDN
eukprot:CAMPEP_0170795836 /NCGR_PEP_ID=MMETSP0733-20121128/24413_1 /TAXON_ID=186038 /ORGANISM="Fragilariopsis kerguelensis, Strain L26-C5" /LENGTH=110 /DNA_ID=CAMNT_0011145905 /DNA_START=118 /DNA_END=450 /DNA_ORIENTATION=-